MRGFTVCHREGTVVGAACSPHQADPAGRELHRVRLDASARPNPHGDLGTPWVSPAPFSSRSSSAAWSSACVLSRAPRPARWGRGHVDHFGLRTITARSPPAAIPCFVNFWNSFVSFRHESRKTAEQHREACLQPLDHDPELVFTHTDLAPRNLILEDGTGGLWVVDWDEAGFYPRYFEYAGMHNFYVPEGWTWLARLRWRFFAWLVAGSWAREHRFLSEALRKAQRFGASRQFNIKAGASASERTNLD
ncbi:hypothetical protein RB594_008596 [Gaeumannomyces avenae]